MNENRPIEIRGFAPFYADDLSRILRSLVSLKKEYDAYSEELDEYEKTISTLKSITVKTHVVRHIEEAVSLGHESCIKRMLSIVSETLEANRESKIPNRDV